MVFQKFTHKGVFRPKNPDKYVGNSKNIIYRSSWEKRFMIYCDNTPEVISWASEELSIPYISPLDGRVHKYYPDFIIYYKTPEKLKTSVIEVKPQKETKPPRKKKNKKLFLQEIRTWEVNKSKWAAAEEYCENRGWEFIIMTEKQLKPNK